MPYCDRCARLIDTDTLTEAALDPDPEPDPTPHTFSEADLIAIYEAGVVAGRALTLADSHIFWRP